MFNHREARNKLAELKQRTTVAKLFEDLQEICMHIPEITEDEKMDKAIRALQPHICEHVLACEPTTMQEVQRLALAKDGARASINSRLSLPRAQLDRRLDLESLRLQDGYHRLK
ncbi:uncharacterized protein BX664DRAFT_313166 [Halteromyces radiatus]|uniref:uncharacterized protein n=1 Tax=Halteromyces radiatus TaxID=101107 RepID=UPI00221F0403|nr:uncharacterized protein BX664DRAFT_313166 [Halteromyces radiatus]KAI8093075.1 hypothetical protein BX664DRAFT_313166 [Halteromyces radiatus]